jgi:hypothetical protein
MKGLPDAPLLCFSRDGKPPQTIGDKGGGFRTSKRTIFLKNRCDRK